MGFFYVGELMAMKDPLKLGILAHIAGNYDGLVAIDQLFDERGVDHKICLGDIVGLYPFVDECISHLQEKNYITVKSKIDAEFAENGPYEFWSTIYLVDALKYTYTKTSQETIQQIQELPYTQEFEGIRLISLMPVNKKSWKGILQTRNIPASQMPEIGNCWDYINTSEDAKKNFSIFSEKIILHHACQEATLCAENMEWCVLREGLHPLPEDRLLASIGGFGCQYMGSLLCPTVGILDLEAKTLEIIDVRKICPYPVGKLAAMEEYPKGPLAFLSNHEYKISEEDIEVLAQRKVSSSQRDFDFRFLSEFIPYLWVIAFLITAHISVYLLGGETSFKFFFVFLVIVVLYGCYKSLRES